jgi:protein-L-isoaspartate(D-aspartate) O-methyltransferase
LYLKDDMIRAREAMVRRLMDQGIASRRVLEAMLTVPRHFFISEAFRFHAYEDTSLPIGCGQTISKPSVIALMLNSLEIRGGERILEIGTGSGYQSALAAAMGAEVVTMERIPELHHRAREVLAHLGYGMVQTLCTDSFHQAPGAFDGICAAAGMPELPDGIFEKLTDRGILVAPVGAHGTHRITCYRRYGETIEEEPIGRATFVPYIVSRTPSEVPV